MTDCVLASLLDQRAFGCIACKARHRCARNAKGLVGSSKENMVIYCVVQPKQSKSVRMHRLSVAVGTSLTAMSRTVSGRAVVGPVD